jgi:hypothetical protein
MSIARKWMEVVIIRLSEVRQVKNNNMFSLMCRIKIYIYTYTCIYKIYIYNRYRYRYRYK